MLDLSEFLDYSSGTVRVSDFGWDYNHKLCIVVAQRFFSFADKEDLVSLAVIDLAEFILRTLVDGDTPRSVRNVLFTRARNVMCNYLHHIKKVCSTDDTILALETSPHNADDYNVCFDYNFSSLEEAHSLSLKIWCLYRFKKLNKREMLRLFPKIGEK